MTPPTETPAPVAEAADGPVGEFLRDVGLAAEVADVLGDAITFVVVLAAVYLLGKLIVFRAFERVMDRRNLDAHARKPLRKLVAALLAFVGISAAFGAAGYGSFLTALATIAGAATLAVGFAMQDVIKNFVAGIFIFTDRPFRIGDWIEWDDYAGRVEDISMRVTRVRTFDNELLTVPNATLTDDVITNPVEAGRLRMRFTFGIGYDDDIEEATEIILAAADDDEDILEEPAPSVRMTEMADSYVGLQARVWISDPTRGTYVRIRGEFATDVKQRFDEAGIDIPYPQRVLHGGLDVHDPTDGAAVEDD
jgi:small-conductance mechanosensitive channel